MCESFRRRVAPVADVQSGPRRTAGAALECNHAECAFAPLAVIEVVNQAGVPLTLAQLRIDERVLHFLTGLHHLDERLMGMIEPITGVEELALSQQQLARTISLAWSRANTELPLLQIAEPMNSRDGTSPLLVARARVCTALRLARK